MLVCKGEEQGVNNELIGKVGFKMLIFSLKIRVKEIELVNNKVRDIPLKLFDLVLSL